MILPSSPQLAPRGVKTSHNVTGAPPNNDRAAYFGDPALQAIGARYLRDNIKYRLGDAERAGLETFYRYAAELDASYHRAEVSEADVAGVAQVTKRAMVEAMGVNLLRRTADRELCADRRPC